MINEKLLKGAAAGAAGPLYDIEASNTDSYSGTGTSITNIGSVTGLTTTLSQENFQGIPYKGNWHFENSGQYIALPTLNNVYTSTPSYVTIELWVRVENANYYQNFVTNSDGGAFDGEYTIGMFSLQTSTWENYIFYQVGQSSTTGYLQAKSGNRIQPGVWNHIVLTHDFTQSTNANILKMYMNGVQETVTIVNQAGTIDATSFTSSKSHSAGRSATGATNFLMGNIAQIRFYDLLLDSAAVLDRYDTTKSLYGHNIGRSYTNTGITSSSNSALLSHFKLDNNGTDAEGTENLTTQPSGYNAVVFSDKLNLFGTYSAGMYGRSEQVTSGSKQGTIMQFSGQYAGKTLPMAVSMWIQAGSTLHPSHAQYQDFKMASFVNGSTLSSSIGGRNRGYDGKIFMSTTGGSGSFAGTQRIDTGEWTHVVFNFNSNGNTTSIYVNGQLDNSVTNFNPGTRSYDEGFGGEDNNFNDNHQFFNGMFDNIRIYNRVLTASEVETLFLEGSSGSEVEAGEMEWLVVAGGGSGGKYQSAGGGAGGLRTSFGELSGGGSLAQSAITLSSGTYTITVGAGGTAPTSNDNGNDGSSSSIAKSGMTTISTVGGGGAGAHGGNPSTDKHGRSGGSGSGAWSNYQTSGGSGTSGEGYDGGNGGNYTIAYGEGAGGGGGAGAPGVTGENGIRSNGGDGLAVGITGGLRYYAGGGGAHAPCSGVNAIQPGGYGGSGGGGNGGYCSTGNIDGTSGKANTGGGGGGGATTGTPATAVGAGGNGGSGVVILRLKTSEYSGTTTGSPSVTTVGDDTVLIYTGSGTYVH